MSIYLHLPMTLGGAQVEHHRVAAIRLHADFLRAEADVESWHTEADRLSGYSPVARAIYRAPLAALQGAAAGFVQSLIAALVARDDGMPGAVVIADAQQDLATLRSLRWQTLKAEREARDQAAIEVDGIALDGDMQSRQDLMGAIMAMQISGDISRPWRCADNTMHTLTLAQLIAAGTGIAARRQALIETSDDLYQQLQAASTADEIAAVVWQAP